MDKYRTDKFYEHIKHLITCDKYGNQPNFLGIKNHMAISRELMGLWEVVRENQEILILPDVDERLQKLERKLDEIYGSNKKED